MADDILLIMAKRDGRYIAGALNLSAATRCSGAIGAALKTTRFAFRGLLLSGD